MAKGHHPTIRVKHWTNKIKAKKRSIKAIRVVVLATRHLFMIQKESGYTTSRTDRYGYGVGDVVDTQLAISALSSASSATEFEVVGCSESGTWYVDTKGCGMQNATPTNSPPKKGFLRNAMRYAASVLLIALMAIANACHKDPIPEPQPSPIIPTKEITIVWNWEANLGWAPPKDSVKYYTDQDSVKSVYIHIMGDQGPDFPVNCGGFPPWVFHKARDTLQTRIDIAERKVKLSGIILVNPTNGAHLQNHDYTQGDGMAYYDSVWFTSNGCTVRRPIYSK